FIASVHFILGAAKLLHRKSVAELLPSKAFDICLGSKLNLAVSETHIPREFESCVKAAQGIHGYLAFDQFVLGIIFDLIAQLSDYATEWTNISVACSADASNPTLEMDFFTGAIELAIIENVPAQIVGTRVMSPGAPARPDFGVFREHSY